MKKIRCRSGALTIQTSVFILVVMATLSLVLSVFPVFNRASVQNAVAHDLVRFIELRGAFDNKAKEEFERLKAVSGIDCSLTVTADNPNKIQFGKEFTVTIKSTARIGLGGILSVPITITSTVTGRSEKYWK